MASDESEGGKGTAGKGKAAPPKKTMLGMQPALPTGIGGAKPAAPAAGKPDEPRGLQLPKGTVMGMPAVGRPPGAPNPTVRGMPAVAAPPASSFFESVRPKKGGVAPPLPAVPDARLPTFEDEAPEAAAPPPPPAAAEPAAPPEPAPDVSPPSEPDATDEADGGADLAFAATSLGLPAVPPPGLLSQDDQESDAAASDSDAPENFAVRVDRDAPKPAALPVLEPVLGGDAEATEPAEEPAAPEPARDDAADLEAEEESDDDESADDGYELEESLPAPAPPPQAASKERSPWPALFALVVVAGGGAAYWFAMGGGAASLRGASQPEAASPATAPAEPKPASAGATEPAPAAAAEPAAEGEAEGEGEGEGESPAEAEGQAAAAEPEAVEEPAAEEPREAAPVEAAAAKQPEPEPEPEPEPATDEPGAAAEGRYAQARELVQSAIALKRLRKLDEAAANYHRALELYPDYPRAMLNLGRLQLRMGKPAEALAVARKLTAIQAHRSNNHLLLGDALAASGQAAEARVAWEKAQGMGNPQAAERLQAAPK